MSPEETSKKKVLVTGSSGFVGRLIIPYLRRSGFFIRGYGRSPDTVSDEFTEGAVEDTESLREALSGMDSVVHLAAFSDDGDFLRQILEPNIVGVYSLFEALKGSKAQRVVLASSTQAADIDHLPGTVPSELSCPSNYYGLSKIWLEKAGEMNARLQQLDVIAARLGWIIRSKSEFEEISKKKGWQKLYLSHLDAQRFFLSCLSAPVSGFSVVNAVSRPVHSNRYDMEKTRKVTGFQPDNAFPDGLIQQLVV
ncbi:MAG: NAD(P)-dependent oxidoreductase [Cytophagales bacterium]|nr:NAD(P)-dependent oxidoreductase [Cytophagales bacterium]